MIKENGITYLDETVYNYFCNEQGSRNLYRYMDYSKMKKGKLWFSNPSTWNDPYEKLFLYSTYLKRRNVGIEYPLLNRVFCICLTSISSSEAAWKVYNCATKFSIDTGKMLQVLSESAKDFDVYIGKVNYKDKKCLKENGILKLTDSPSFDCFLSNDAWVKLLLLKRLEFQSEEEIRIILVSKENIKTPKDGINLNFTTPMSELFHHVELSPFLYSLEEEQVKMRLISRFGFLFDQISVSDLYKSVEVRKLRMY